MYLIGLELARTRGTLPPAEIEFILDEVWELPDEDAAVPATASHPIDDIAQRFYHEPFFLFLGRHIGLPVALEGALKLKEISYIPTEAYSAGEMKHGPIALLEEGTPVVVVATSMNTVYDKIVSNIQETRARGAHVIAIATDGNEDIQHHANDVIYVPEVAGVPPGGARDAAAAAPRLPDRAAARPERRPAPEPREDGHGRVRLSGHVWGQTPDTPRRPSLGRGMDRGFAFWQTTTVPPHAGPAVAPECRSSSDARAPLFFRQRVRRPFPPTSSAVATKALAAAEW